MTKSKIFLILSLAFIGGILLRSFLKFETIFLSILLLAGLIIFFTFYRNLKAFVIAFFIFFFAFGIWLTDEKLQKLENLNLDGKNFSGTVRIIKEPEIKDRYQKITIQAEKANSNSSIGSEQESSLQGERFLTSVYSYPQYNYGDELKIDCKLEIPENKTFDYQMYLAKERIFYLCQNPKIELLSRENGNFAYHFILKIKNKLQVNINALIPAPQSGLLVGLLLGGDDQLSKDVQANFSQTGMTHIVAVSGYNVTIIAEYLILFAIFIGFWRQQSFWFALVGIVIFVVMIGMPSSAVRAGIMGVLLIWAMKNGRLANSTNAIIFAGAVMLLLNPLLLRYDIGFQLSFLATLGIVYFSPFLNTNLINKNKTFGLWEILVLTLSAQLFVLPIIFYNFKTLSIVSPLANLLVLPIIPLTMLLGFLMLVFKFIFPPLGMVFAWLTFLPLKYEVEMINFLANLKYASVKIENFPWWGVVVWYIILVVIVFFLKKNAKSKINL